MVRRCGCAVDYLPVCFVAIFLISLSISFTIAVAQSDVLPWFPAISDTATSSPESNIFSQLTNIATFVGIVLVYVRFLQVKRDVECLEGSRSATRLNCVGLLVGWFAILGGSIVANFPETQVRAVHDIGAGMLFIFGTVYAWLQVMISFQMKTFGLVSSCTCYTRVVLSLISTVTFIVSMVMSSYAGRQWSGDKFHWRSDDPGYKEHVIGNVCEWLMVFTFLFMFLTFTKEFCQHKLQIKLVGYREDYEPIIVSF